jgi:hypothetical protein
VPQLEERTREPQHGGHGERAPPSRRPASGCAQGNGGAGGRDGARQRGSRGEVLQLLRDQQQHTHTTVGTEWILGSFHNVNKAFRSIRLKYKANSGVSLGRLDYEGNA